MISESLFIDFIKNTFLSFLNDDEIRRVYTFYSHLSLGSFEKIPREDFPQNLYFVFEGQITIKNRSHGLEMYALKKYQSIDLKALLLRHQQWATDWFTKSSVEVIKIQYSCLDELFKKYPQEIDYLSKLTQSISLQKFKKDVLAFGFSQELVKNIVLSLKFCSVKEFNETAIVDFYFIASLYDDLLVKNKNSTDKTEQQLILLTGDIFISRSKQTELQIQSSVYDAKLFYLPNHEYLKLSKNKEFANWLDFLGKNENSSKSKSKSKSKSLKPDIIPKNKTLIQGSYSDFYAVDEISTWNFFFQKVTSLATENHRNSYFITQILFKEFKVSATRINHLKGFALIEQNDCILTFSDFLRMNEFTLAVSRFSDLKNKKNLSYFIIQTEQGLQLFKKISSSHVSKYNIKNGHIETVQIGDLESSCVSGEVIVVSAFQTKSKEVPAMIQIENFWKMIADKKYLLLLLVALSLVSSVCILSLPILTQYVIDQVIQLNKTEHVFSMILMMAGLSGYSVFIDWYIQRLSNYLTQTLSYRLKNFFNQQFFLRKNYIHPSLFLSRTLEIETLSQYYFNQYLPALSHIFMTAVTFCIIASYNFKLSLALCIFVPFNFIFVYLLKDKISHLKEMYLKSKSNEHQVLIQSFGYSRSVKLLKNYLVTRWKIDLVLSMTISYLNANTTLQILLQTVQIFKTELVRIIVIMLSLVYYSAGELSLGQVFALMLLAPRFANEIQILISAYSQYFSFSTLCQKLNETVDSKNQDLWPEQQKVTQFDSFRKINNPLQKISAHSVTDRDLILQNLNFECHVGRTTCFFAPSGAGKSILAKLLSDLEVPSAGFFVFEYSKTSSEGRPEKNTRTALISHESCLFADTLLYNITLDREAPNLERIYEILHFFEWYDEFLSKPNGLLFSVGHDGHIVSPSFRSKILILRAAYESADLVILDDATRFFDAVTEVEFVRRLKSWFKHSVVIVLTSKPSLASKMDQIYVMEQGSIATVGTSASLAQAHGLYAFHLSQCQSQKTELDFTGS